MMASQRAFVYLVALVIMCYGQMVQQTDKDKLVCVDDFRRAARKLRDDYSWHYFNDGAMSMTSTIDNEAAFKRYRLLPRMLQNVGNRSLATKILGHPVSMPIGIAPFAYHKWANPGGEIVTAKAAAKVGSLMAVSCHANTKMEDIAAAVPDALLFMQIRFFGLRNVTVNFTRRAEISGYKAIVVTVDTPIEGNHYHIARNGWHPPKNCTRPNYEDQSWEYLRRLANPWATWKDLEWLKTKTKLPIIIKGILSAEDAKMASQHGADAIWVSNHGGRVLDGGLSTMDALEAVVKAVPKRVEVYVDGGIRSGTDIVKALALGARAVFLGRPIIWGLMYDGEVGVQKVLSILKKETDNQMAQTGATTPGGLKPSMVLRPHSIAP